MTRAELVALVRGSRRSVVSREMAERAVDVVLDQVLAMATPRLEREWTGSEVLQELKRWRSHG